MVSREEGTPASADHRKAPVELRSRGLDRGDRRAVALRSSTSPAWQPRSSYVCCSRPEDALQRETCEPHEQIPSHNPLDVALLAERPVLSFARTQRARFVECPDTITPEQKRPDAMRKAEVRVQAIHDASWRSHQDTTHPLPSIESERRFSESCEPRSCAMSSASDHDLGMGRAIPRRDFVSGVGVALTGSLLPLGSADTLLPLLNGSQERIDPPEPRSGGARATDRAVGTAPARRPRYHPLGAQEGRRRPPLLPSPDLHRLHRPNRNAARSAAPGRRFEFFATVEAAGVEPASAFASCRAATCVDR